MRHADIARQQQRCSHVRCSHPATRVLGMEHILLYLPHSLRTSGYNSLLRHHKHAEFSRTPPWQSKVLKLHGASLTLEIIASGNLLWKIG